MNYHDPIFLEELKNLKIKFKYLKDKIAILREQGHIIFPEQKNILRSVEALSFDAIKVVILGQDPYVSEGEANGLAFSVNKGIKIPMSLRNIYKELQTDLNIEFPSHGDLSSWASQGVLLLNRILTVEQGRPLSHAKLGWDTFTEDLIKLVNKYNESVVFILWGNNAKQVIPFIDKSRHLILTAAHPSPLSASRGFFGCKHFSKANTYLIGAGKQAIDWRIL